MRNFDRFYTIPDMDYNEIIQAMMDDAGMNGADLSRALGKTPGYVAATFSRRSVPRLDTFVQMARVMGFEIVLERRDSDLSFKIRID